MTSQKTSQVKYISTVDTAKLIRAALRENFPGMKFSVKSSHYSMGSAVDVRWLDGPSAAEVEKITGHFEGSYMNIYDDSREYRTVEHDGELVRFGPDSVHLERRYSARAWRLVITRVCEYWNIDEASLKFKVDEYDDGEGRLEIDYFPVHQSGESFVMLLNRDMAKWSDYVKPAEAIPVAPLPNTKTAPKPVASNIIKLDDNIAPAARVEDYKGFPVIVLPLKGEKEFSFGVQKAKAILANIDAIRAFVDSQEK